MTVLRKKVLDDFIKKHGDAGSRIRSWYYEVKSAAWKNPGDVRARYAAASFVKKKIVFNIGGNRYRIIAEADYLEQIIVVIFAGTHAEYDKINVTEI